MPQNLAAWNFYGQLGSLACTTVAKLDRVLVASSAAASRCRLPLAHETSLSNPPQPPAVEAMGLKLNGREFRRIWRMFDVSGEDDAIPYTKFNNKFGIFIKPMR